MVIVKYLLAGFLYGIPSERQIERRVQTATADAAYDFPLAHRALGKLGIDFFVRPQKNAARASVQFTQGDFCRDENRDVYLCPDGKELRLRRLARRASR